MILKTKKRSFITVISLALVFVMLFGAVPKTPAYADPYLEMQGYSGIPDGDWYNGEYVLSISSDGEGKYSLTKTLHTTGETETLLDNLENEEINGDYDRYYISAIYKNFVYITRSSFGNWKFTTYRYDLETGAYKRAMQNCGLLARSGRYAVGKNQFQSDVSARKHSLYRIEDDGKLTKIKSLGYVGPDVKFIGKNLYYQSCTDESMSDAKIIRLSRDGKTRKVLGTIKPKGEYSFVFCYDFTSTKCKVTKNGKEYIYTYKTKKFKRTRN